MLRTPEDVTKNYEERNKLVQEIVTNQKLVESYLADDPADLLKTCSHRLAQAYFDLYTANKEYDEYFETLVYRPNVPKKKLWQKLLRK